MCVCVYVHLGCKCVQSLQVKSHSYLYLHRHMLEWWPVHMHTNIMCLSHLGNCQCQRRAATHTGYDSWLADGPPTSVMATTEDIARLSGGVIQKSGDITFLTFFIIMWTLSKTMNPYQPVTLCLYKNIHLFFGYDVSHYKLRLPHCRISAGWKHEWFLQW